MGYRACLGIIRLAELSLRRCSPSTRNGVRFRFGMLFSLAGIPSKVSFVAAQIASNSVWSVRIGNVNPRTDTADVGRPLRGIPIRHHVRDD
jgi:hypothetical protein